MCAYTLILVMLSLSCEVALFSSCTSCRCKRCLIYMCICAVRAVYILVLMSMSTLDSSEQVHLVIDVILVAIAVFGRCRVVRDCCQYAGGVDSVVRLVRWCR